MWSLVVISIVSICLPYSTLGVFTGPVDRTVVLGGDVTLTCSNTDYTGVGFAQWSENSRPFATQTGGVVDDPAYEKYTNFEIVSSSSSQMDLKVTAAELEDEGTYACALGTAPAVEATLTIEVEGVTPVITLDGDSSGNRIILTASEESVLRCTANNYRPEVSLEWYKDNAKLTAGISEDTPTDNGDGTSSSSGTLTFTPTRQDNELSLECRTTGQTEAPSKTGSLVLDVQYVPVVEVMYSGGSITCSADANPLASSYKIILNGTEVFRTFTTSGQSVEYVPDSCTTISCNATNTIDTGMGEVLGNPICPVEETTTEMPTTGYVDMTTQGTAKPTKPTIKPGARGPSKGMKAVISMCVVLPILIAVLLAILWCYKKEKFCFSNKTTPSSKSQTVAVKADMVRNQAEVRQSIHNYGDEPKKPRLPRSNTGGGQGNPPPPVNKADNDCPPVNPRDMEDGNQHGQSGLNYCEVDFQKNREQETNGHGSVNPPSEEPTQYASILV